MAKIQISINDELLKRVDDYADESYTSRSGLICSAVVDYLNTRETIQLVKNLSLAIGKIAETGEVDDATMALINDFERFTKLAKIGTN